MKKITNILTALILTLGIISCNNEEPPLPENFVQFQAEQLGITASENEIEVKVVFSRATEENAILSIEVSSEGLSYGEDYVTDPVIENEALTIDIPAGSTEVSFVLSKVEDRIFDGDEFIKFTIKNVEGLHIGDKAELILSFAEIIATHSKIVLNGGGANYPNKVFIDLSANRQVAVERSAWDLGFYAGEDHFKVILNSSTGMMARAIDKTDLAEVTAQDTVGFESQMSFHAFSTDAMNWVDAHADLSNTAIATVSSNNTENKVYIINRGTGTGSPALHRGWKKIKVIRNGNGYTLQHADIGSATFQETQITKNEAYQYVYAHFETGAVNVEPEREKWDIAWTAFTYYTAFGGGNIPYFFQDIVLQNTAGVETAKILSDDVSFENFTESHLSEIDFSTSQIAIGADWRRTSPAPAEVYEDRYYLVKDISGNIYKLRFTALTQNAERGRPEIEFVLVKSGN